jgi:hypothetical protein
MAVPGATAYSWSFPGGTTITNPATTINIGGGTPTVYSLSVTANNACGISAVQVISINVVASPTITVNSGSICAGGSFVITPAGAGSYTIQGGSANVSPITNTSYTVVGSNGGCISLPVTANVSVSPKPIIIVNSGTVQCIGGTFTINPFGAASYSFSSGSAIVSPTVTSTYTVTGTSTAGCVSAPVVSTITVNGLPAPVLLVSLSSSATCLGEAVSFSVSGASSYTWSTGSNNPGFVITPQASAVYTVIATGANTCKTQTTVAHTVAACVGLREEPGAAMRLRVFPNPGQDEFTVSIDPVPADAQLEVYTVQGQLISRTKIVGKTTSLFLQQAASGIYLLKICSNGTVIEQTKLVKQ